MTVEVLSQGIQPRLAEIDADLSVAMQRVCAVAESVVLTKDGLCDLAGIYNNLAYLFLYLASNAAHVDWRSLEHWKYSFYSDDVLVEKLERILAQSRLEDVEADRVRKSYLEFFRRLRHRDDGERDERHDLLERARDCRAALRTDQEQFLARLGTRVRGTPEAAFYNLISLTETAATREKLATAWTQIRDHRSPALETVADELVGYRRERSRRRGFTSALEETLRRSRLSGAQVETFIANCVKRALESQHRLDDEVRSRLGLTGAPMQHFEHYVRRVQGDVQIPLFNLERCLGFAFGVAKATFGLEFSCEVDARANVIHAAVSQAERECGAVNFDLWDDARAPRSSNTTVGARNRMAWAGRLQLPVAHVSCRFKRRGDQGSAITFQNVHSLFHEFGHAINHLCIARVIPSESGLEYLPIERLETLSMWFEKWVFHPAFVSAVAQESDVQKRIRVAQAIKRLEYRRTHLERAVTAALDFEANRYPDMTVRAAFQALDDRFGISSHCAAEDFLASFTLPMLDANPGGYFAYLWGASESAQHYVPWRSSDPGTWPDGERARTLFASCLDFDVPSTSVDAGAAFSFYEEDVAID
jgi:oligopeptidase A